jgi:hypothetical protein
VWTFNCPASLALDVEGNVLVADFNNSVIRCVTMTGVVSTVVGNGEKGFADGEDVWRTQFVVSDRFFFFDFKDMSGRIVCFITTQKSVWSNLIGQWTYLKLS